MAWEVIPRAAEAEAWSMENKNQQNVSRCSRLANAVPGEPVQGNYTSDVLYGFNNMVVENGGGRMFYSCQERLTSAISTETTA